MILDWPFLILDWPFLILDWPFLILDWPFLISAINNQRSSLHALKYI